MREGSQAEPILVALGIARLASAMRECRRQRAASSSANRDARPWRRRERRASRRRKAPIGANRRRGRARSARVQTPQGRRPRRAVDERQRRESRPPRRPPRGGQLGVQLTQFAQIGLRWTSRLTAAEVALMCATSSASRASSTRATRVEARPAAGQRRSSPSASLTPGHHSSPPYHDSETSGQGRCHVLVPGRRRAAVLARPRPSVVSGSPAV